MYDMLLKMCEMASQCRKRSPNNKYIGLSCFPNGEYTSSFNPPLNTGDSGIPDHEYTGEAHQGVTPGEPHQGFILAAITGSHPKKSPRGAKPRIHPGKSHLYSGEDNGSRLRIRITPKIYSKITDPF
jgi:hypothetical protein